MQEHWEPLQEPAAVGVHDVDGIADVVHGSGDQPETAAGGVGAALSALEAAGVGPAAPEAATAGASGHVSDASSARAPADASHAAGGGGQAAQGPDVAAVAGGFDGGPPVAKGAWPGAPAAVGGGAADAPADASYAAGADASVIAANASGLAGGFGAAGPAAASDETRVGAGWHFGGDAVSGQGWPAVAGTGDMAGAAAAFQAAHGEGGRQAAAGGAAEVRQGKDRLTPPPPKPRREM
jgi:hypothetical protein